MIQPTPKMRLYCGYISISAHGKIPRRKCACNVRAVKEVADLKMKVLYLENEEEEINEEVGVQSRPRVSTSKASKERTEKHSI